MTDENDVKRIFRMVRRSNAIAIVNLSQRRNWYDDTPEPTPEQTTPQDGKQPNVTPDGKNAEQKLFTQEQQIHVDNIVESRLARQERELTAKILGDYGVTNKAELKDKMALLEQADEKRLADEEAEKSEIQKLNDRLSSSVALHEKEVATNRDLLIRLAINECAAGKEVDPAHLRDLRTLMDKSSITVTDGVVDIQTVEAAIDATLEGRDYLKAKAGNSRTPGSPPSKKMLPQQQPNQKQPVTRGRNRPSM